MGMTIDESKMRLSMQQSYMLGKDCEAIQVAMNTMRKYQKIEQIMKSDTYKGIFTYTDDTRLNHIREVLDNGNNTTTGC